MSLPWSRGLRAGGGASLLPETVTLIEAMPAKPDAARTKLINQTIASLTACGAWGRIDYLFCLAAHEENAALINWSRPGTSDAIVEGTPTFTADRGFAGDGVSARLVIPRDDLLFSLDDASMSAWCQDGGSDFTDIAGAISNRHRLNPSNGTIMYGRLNSNALVTAPNTQRTNTFTFLNTDNSDTQSISLNAGARVVDIRSLNNMGGNFAILSSSTLYTTARVAWFHAGGSITEDQEAGMYQALLAYNQAVGASP